MKRIFKIATVFALAGAALVGNGCSKDYGEEIASVKKDLQTLTDGTVATHTSQIAGINTEIENLKKMDETLKGSIEKVQSNLDAAYKELKEAIEKKATSAAIEALQGRCTALESDLAALVTRVAVNETNISNLQDLVKSKADTSWVLLTFATKDENEKVAKELGALSQTVEELDAAYKKADTELQEGINAVSEDLTKAKKELSDAIALKADQTTVDALTQRVGTLENSLSLLEKAVKTNADAITDIQGDIATINGQISTINGQIQTLQGDVQDLWTNFNLYYQKGKVDEMIADLNTRVDSLDAAVATKISAEAKARFSGDTALANKIKFETEELQAQIDKINDEVIPALAQADKDLRTAIDSVQNNLNAEILARMAKDKILQDSIELVIKMYQQADEYLQNQINDLQTDLNNEAQYRTDADNILDGKISDEVFNRLEAEGKIDEKIEKEILARENAVIEVQGNLETEIQDRIAAVAGLQNDLNTFINNVIGYNPETEGGKTLKQYIDDRVEEEIGGRSQSIKALTERVEGIEVTITEIQASISSLESDVDALKAQITSIVIKPTTIPEIITVKVGSESANLFRATFVVEPAAAAAKITKDNLTVSYTEGLPRINTKGFLGDEAATITRVETSGNQVTVWAKRIQKKGDDGNAYYFSFKFNGGDYTINSDFAQAIEGDQEYDLLGANQCFGYSSPDTKYMVGEDKSGIDLDYVAAASASYQPFKGYDYAFKAYDDDVLDAFFDCDSVYTNNELIVTLGMAVNIVGTKQEEAPAVADSKWFDRAKITFKPASGKSLQDYIGELGYVMFGYTVNGTQAPGFLTANYNITRVVHAPEQLDNINLYWNYKTYKFGDRTDTITNARLLENAVWARTTSLEYSASAQPLSTPYTLGAGSSIAKIKVGEYDNGAMDYTSLTFTPVEDLINEEIIKDTVEIFKANSTDEYTFRIPVKVDTVLAAVGVDGTAKAEGSITKPVTIGFKDFALNFICDANNNIRKQLVSGLTGAEAEYSAIEDAFQSIAGSTPEPTSVTLNGYDITGVTTKYKAGRDSIYFTIPAGYLNYNAKDQEFRAEFDFFGVNYAVNITFSTGAPKFSIETLPYVVEGIAPVRGSTTSGVYLINDIALNQHVQLVGLDKANEDPDAAFTVGFSLNKEKKTSGSTTYPGSISVDKENGRLGDGKLDWNTYDGLKLDALAVVSVNGTPVSGCSVEYTIKTDVPVEFKSPGAIDTVKLPAEDLTMIVTKKAEVYGMVDGSFDYANNLVNVEDGTIKTSPEYKGTKFVFDDLKTISATVNGTAMTLTKDIDYKWNKDTYELIMTGDNIHGTVEFTIPVTLYYYLDYNHTKAIEKNISIKYKANPAN